MYMHSHLNTLNFSTGYWHMGFCYWVKSSFKHKPGLHMFCMPEKKKNGVSSYKEMNVSGIQAGQDFSGASWSPKNLFRWPRPKLRCLEFMPRKPIKTEEP